MTDAPPLAADLTLDEARALLEAQVRKTTWGRRGLAARLSVFFFERTGAFDVIFSSFTESRRVEQTHEPHEGGSVDGPENGPAPGPWDIRAQMPPAFTPEHRVAIRVPHTEHVLSCHRCGGDGRVTCSNCGGSGRVNCSSCGGDGRVSRTRTVTEHNAQGQPTTRTEHYTESCSSCGSSGRVTCTNCGGDGQVTCGTCKGRRMLRHFALLHVRWSTRTLSEQIEKTDLPDALVSKAKGDEIHREDEEYLEPGRGGEGRGPYRGVAVRVNADVEEAANRLIAKHSLTEGDKLHRQRLVVRAVPVWEARYHWGSEVRRFWIYGKDRRVHAPNFPISRLRVAGAILGSAAVPTSLVAAYAMSGPARPPEPSYTYTPPPTITAPVLPPSIPIPPKKPPPPPPPLASAKGKRPAAPPGKAVVELRTDPPGLEVLVKGRKVGVSPLFVTIDAKSGGECTGGVCTSGSCTGGTCVGGMCGGGSCQSGDVMCSGGMCSGGMCSGGTCSGQRCQGATCPAGYRCRGATCTGGSCASASCTGGMCAGSICAGTTCIGGSCIGGSCSGACTGGVCGGGACELVTEVTVRGGKEGERVVAVGPSDGAVIEVR